MARSRLELRRQAEAAERLAEEQAKDAAETGVAPVVAKPAKKKATPKKPSTAKPRAKAKKADAARMRMVWGLFDNGNQQVATFPFAERAAAETKLGEMVDKPRGPYYLQPVREPMPVAAPAGEGDG